MHLMKEYEGKGFILPNINDNLKLHKENYTESLKKDYVLQRMLLLKSSGTGTSGLVERAS